MATEADMAFREFDLDLDHIIKDLIPEQANLFKQKVGMQILTGVVKKTRVDFGRARGGWSTRVNVPQLEESGELDPNGEATISKGAMIIATAQFGDDIWVSNPVNYVQYLNDGTEHMDGDFMLERTIHEVESQFI